jgi:hypothetical protein
MPLPKRCRLQLHRLEDRVTPASVFSGAGTTAAGSAFASFKAAIGGADNGNAGPQKTGFRTINWDGVGLGATDGAFTNEVITPNHTVGIPLNRFQQRGMFLNDIYAVTDTGFTTENPGLQPPVQFPPFSGTKIFAMFNDNSIDFHFVRPSAATTNPVDAASRGFGAIFLDVEKANTTSIEYFHGTTSLGKYFVPAGPSTQPEFLGVLFDNPVVTDVTMTLGDGVLFDFNGTKVTSGPPDMSVFGSVDQVATDDFVYAEPTVPTAITAAGAGFGNLPVVKVFDAAGNMTNSFLAYSAAFLGGVHVAVGDVNGDGVPDIVTGAGFGGAPHVKVFSGVDNSLLYSFFAYGATFPGGVNVAVADVNGDGKADIITGAGPTGGPHVKVFSGADLTELDSFFAYGATFSGGVNVAGGDVNGDGKADIITGAGQGGGPHVKVFNGTDLSLLASFYAYDATFTGGVNVASADITGDGKADIITGAGEGGGPHVKVFNGADLSTLASFFAYPVFFGGGVTVAAGDINGDGRPDIIAGTQLALATITDFDGTTLAQLNQFNAFDPTPLGGVFVGASS